MNAAMDELNRNGGGGGGGGGGVGENVEGLAVIGKGKPLIVLMCATLVYYHCAYRNSSILSLTSDVFIVLLCSLAILGLLFLQMNIHMRIG
ncbi:hypothetical protein L1987_85700 [Smallanthus sonchifolius]|uniref:Uncharacterized protein n=1 Tax=Smallanthus sonchifolius TaxID=185202 RepID=A0ACB8XYB4_9ASTR|nr:hypothetical protein L1987_85700 [Smallanthus sonchifolius]